MNTKAVAEPSPLDTAKLALALAILLGGVFAYHHYGEASRLLRVGGVIGVIGLSVAIAAMTDKGRQVVGFVRDANIEVRKVVWPTRQETMQTTLIVMIVVVVFGIVLWLLDLALGAAMQAVIGGGA